MATNIVLNDAHIRGLISGAVEHEHTASSYVGVVSHGEVYRPRTAADKATPSVTATQALETLWKPVLTQVYAMPAAQQLKGVLPDPQIGAARIAAPAKPAGGA